MKKNLKIAIIGAGCRGNAYASLFHKAGTSISAMAEPRLFQRNSAAQSFNIDKTHIFSDWREMASLPKLADAVVIATQDNMHTEPALEFLRKGYHVLLEKPMAPSPEECISICNAAKKSGSIFAVCHVLRYTPYFRKLKELIDSGLAGEIITLRHIERVGYWHQAHAFVRGNWRNTSSAAPMIIAKSCHDMDIILYLTGKKCRRVSSFGSLMHFKRENMPASSSGRCMSCPLAEGQCPYSAKEIYLNSRALKGKFGWPVDIITNDLSIEGVKKALLDGPYGNCVYNCDNNVVDHQVVNMEFDNGMTSSFTMTAFTPDGLSRETEIMGSKGYIKGDSNLITTVDFASGKKQLFDITRTEGLLDDGHGGGDNGIVKDFISAVENEDQSMLSSGPEISLEGHLLGFAAEKSRINGSVEQLASLNVCHQS